MQTLLFIIHLIDLYESNKNHIFGKNIKHYIRNLHTSFLYLLIN